MRRVALQTRIADARRVIGRIAFVLLTCLASSDAAAQTPSLPFELKQVGPGIYAAIDGAEHKSGSNAGFVIGDDGVLVVDAFFYPDATKALVAEIRKLTPKPIRYVVNTHYHADHTGGDQVLRDAGAVIIAHRNVRGWVRVNNITLFGDHITPEIKAQVESLPLPDVVTDKDLTVWLGSRRVVVRTVLGHTGGDLIIQVPDADVLFAGDMLWRKIPPNLIDGSVREWLATDAGFATMPAETRFVPGHGDVAGVADVRDFRAYLIDLRRLVGAGRKAKLAGDALMQYVRRSRRRCTPTGRSATAQSRPRSNIWTRSWPGRKGVLCRNRTDPPPFQFILSDRSRGT
jgi:glyoxylase-like metal-dependent hydrolase (beta-lactamase superfamily II)